MHTFSNEIFNSNIILINKYRHIEHIRITC